MNLFSNGNISIEQRNNKASSKSVKQSNKTSISIATEFLNKCTFHCPGCFVNRKNSYTDDHLHHLNNLALQIPQYDIEANEIILGPTDIFGCDNAVDVLTNKNFNKLFDTFRALTLNSTLQSDYKIIDYIVDILEHQYLTKCYLELIVVLDINQYINDEQYIDTLHKNLQRVKNMNIIFSFNIDVTQQLTFDDYINLSKQINQQYNSNIKMIPSFFRSHKTSLIEHHLLKWTDVLNTEYTNKDHNCLLNNITDLYFGGYTYHIYTFKNNMLYINTYLYDFVFDQHTSSQIPLKGQYYNLTDVFNYTTDIINQQFLYAKQTQQCSSCKYLPSCVGKNVLLFMENHNIKQCLLPRKLMDYENNY